MKLNILCLRFIYVIVYISSLSFAFPYDIPLYEYTMVYLRVLLLVDIRVVSSFELLVIRPP